jgi:polyphosphate kinase 2 (PPK2 family)
VKVHSFGRPTPQELDHDFLWRVHREVPARGEIGVFNRSHYEDVLVARVAELAPPEVIEHRYAAIQDFERLLSIEGGGCVQLLKIFLHISRDEQRERLLARLTDPARNWKMDGADLEARAHWDDYQRAYEIALARCSTPFALWRILPADRKWVRNAIASRWIREALEALDPQLPPPRPELQELVRKLQ